MRVDDVGRRVASSPEALLWQPSGRGNYSGAAKGTASGDSISALGLSGLISPVLLSLSEGGYPKGSPSSSGNRRRRRKVWSTGGR